MKIMKWQVLLDEDCKNVLIPELERDYPKAEKLNDPGKIAAVMRDIFHLDTQAEEYVYLIGMTHTAIPVGFFEVAHGSHKECVVGIRELFVRALLSGAAQIALVHNHPGGSVQPSKEDILLTKRVQAAAALLDVNLCDHIILGKEGYYSFFESGQELLSEEEKGEEETDE